MVTSLAILSTGGISAVMVKEALAHPSARPHTHRQPASRTRCSIYYRPSKPLYITNRIGSTFSYRFDRKWYTIYPGNTNTHWIGGGTTTCNQRDYRVQVVHDRSYEKGFQPGSQYVYPNRSYVFIRDEFGYSLR